MTKTTTKEKGKADMVADEGDAVHPEPNTDNANSNKRDGWINGQPATAEEIEKSTRPKA